MIITRNPAERAKTSRKSGVGTRVRSTRPRAEERQSGREERETEDHQPEDGERNRADRVAPELAQAFHRRAEIRDRRLVDLHLVDDGDDPFGASREIAGPGLHLRSSSPSRGETRLLRRPEPSRRRTNRSPPGSGEAARRCLHRERSGRTSTLSSVAEPAAGPDSEVPGVPDADSTCARTVDVSAELPARLNTRKRSTRFITRRPAFYG